MKSRNIIGGFGLVLLLLLSAASVTAQEGKQQQQQLVIPMRGGYFVAFTTAAGSPAGESALSSSFAEAYYQSHTIRRVFVDSGSDFFFGYDLLVEPIADTKQFRVSTRPLSAEDWKDLRGRTAFKTRRLHPDYNAAVLVRASVPQVVDDGDAFALDVLVNPQTGGKIVDLVQVSFDQSKLREAPVSESPPRDYTLADVELNISNYKLLVNGEMVAGARRTGGCAGPLVWFHLPGKGRFIFSLSQHNGYDFRKIAVIEHNKISFNWDGTHYEWFSNSPIIGSGGNWNLWVIHDPDYIPEFYDTPPTQPALRTASNARRIMGSKTEPPLPPAAPSLNFDEENQRNSKSRKPTAVEQAPATVQGSNPATQSQRRARIVIGAADRIENILPKN